MTTKERIAELRKLPDCTETIGLLADVAEAAEEFVNNQGSADANAALRAALAALGGDDAKD